MSATSVEYRSFLEAKFKFEQSTGFEIDPARVNPALKDHIRAIVPWAIKGGRRAFFLNFGLGKTGLQVECMRIIGQETGEPTLITLPLGVRQEFTRDAARFFRGEHAVELKFIRRADEIEHGHSKASAHPIYLTNYETVRDGKLSPSHFVGASLDEAAVLRSYGSQTYQNFLPMYAEVPYRFVATATPAPNRLKELIHYAGFLGIMDTGQALTRYFQRNSEKANDLTLYPHKEMEFWTWCHSWAVFLQKPSDLGCSDEGYDLPPLDVRWHEIPSNHAGAGADLDGQRLMFRDPAAGLQAAAAEKRDSLAARIAKMAELRAEQPTRHVVLWHDLEDERRAIERAIPAAVSVYGSMPLDERERRIIAFSEGEITDLASKPVLNGSGCNLQPHCSWEIFSGVGYKFHDVIQACHRVYRFGQTDPVRIDFIHTEAERPIVKELQAKWAEHDAMQARMAEIIREHGLNHIAAIDRLRRSIGVERLETAGDRFRIARNDCVAEAALLPESSVGLVVTSIPFANQYEYVAAYEDFGHVISNEQFWAQMDFLTPNLFRALQPGRLACVHVKDRILFGNVTGQGVPTVSPFHAEAIFHYQRHGFQFIGMVTVVTDVVRENNQTYRLGYTEMLKDGSKMGVGCPEYILLMRKPQTDRSRGYADVPIVKDPKQYSLARWQLDAHAFWRSSGNRLLSSDELIALGAAKLASYFPRWTMYSGPYDFAKHVGIAEGIEDRRAGALPRTFMALAPGSTAEHVWHDIIRMDTLNKEQSLGRRELHVCPLQLDLIERLVERYSNPDDMVFDPFMGIGSVPYQAVKLGRRGGGSELHEQYYRDACRYLREAERQASAPSLFDLLDDDREAA